MASGMMSALLFFVVLMVSKAGADSSSDRCGQVCAIACPFGNVPDKRGCPSCRCIERPVCPLVKCRACAYGYVYVDGCQTCTCKPGPICKPVVCSNACPNGYLNVNGCQSCTCRPLSPCPLIKCSRNCPYGCLFKNGCRTCTCRTGYKCQDTCGVFCVDRTSMKSALCAQCPCV